MSQSVCRLVWHVGEKFIIGLVEPSSAQPVIPVFRSAKPVIIFPIMSVSEKWAFAVDLGGSKVAVAAVRGDGQILARTTEAVDTSSKSAPIRQIRRLARELANSADVSSAFQAGGVAVPGLVRRSGTIWAPNIPGWEHMPLQRRLERALEIPFAVESDRNAAALGEAWMGAARGKSDAVVLIIGTGIGVGIISGGEIVRGAHDLSGCVGWMVVDDSYTNEVRHVGQLEALTAGAAIARAAAKRITAGTTGLLREYHPSEITARQVADAARQGDREALEMFERAGKMIGRAVANIISILDPEVIIVSGGVAGAADLYMPSLNATARQWAQPLSGRQVRIRLSALGFDANLLGAARLAWKIATSGKAAAAPAEKS